MDNITTQVENIIRRHVSEATLEVSELQRNHIAAALGVTNGHSNGATNGHAVAAAPVASSTKVSAKKPVAKKVAKTAAAAAAPVKKATKTGGGKGVKRDPAVLEQLKTNVLEYVAAHCEELDKKNMKGVTMEALAAGLKTASSDLTLIIKKLVADKKLKTTGQKRATRYFAK
jgi:hypothetical protein